MSLPCASKQQVKAAHTNTAEGGKLQDTRALHHACRPRSPPGLRLAAFSVFKVTTAIFPA